MCNNAIFHNSVHHYKCFFCINISEYTDVIYTSIFSYRYDNILF